MSHTAYPDNIQEADLLKNTDMKNRFQPVCLHFSADESELLCYLRITCNFNYKEPINRKSDLTISLNQLKSC